jgi:hypothetical protein
MTEPKLANSRRAYWLAVGLGLFPIPGGPSNLHGPLWLLACAGLAFFLAGIAIAFQTLGQANADGDLPAAAPRWMRALQYLIGLAIFCCFGDHLDRIRSGRAAIFRNVPLLRSGNECRDRADRFRRWRGHRLVMHSCRCSGWLATISCQVKASRVPVDPVPAAEQALVRFSDDAETRVLAV